MKQFTIGAYAAAMPRAFCGYLVVILGGYAGFWANKKPPEGWQGAFCGLQLIALSIKQ